jgi:CheY-like chemotaxis protein
MNNGAHVLVVSRDQTLLQTRTLILGAFFQVEAAGRALEAETMLVKRAFDLVILCYSLTDDDCRKLIARIRQQEPRPKVLALGAPGASGCAAGADANLILDNGPYALLKKSAEMLGVDLKEKTKKRADRSAPPDEPAENPAS